MAFPASVAVGNPVRASNINVGNNNAVEADSGSLSITPSGANVITSASVSFAAGRFTSAPVVMTQFTTGVSSTTTCQTWPTSITTAGFQMNINRSSTTTTGIIWVAVNSQ